MVQMADNNEAVNIKNELEGPKEEAVREGIEAAGSEIDLTKESERLKDELNKKAVEIKEANDKYIRLYAEFENYKKRVVKDQNESLKFANERLIKEMLPVIDNLERAVEHAKGNSQKEVEVIRGLIAGVELILKQFKDMLCNFGVRELKAVGEPFDPARHEAVSHIETDEHDNNIIINEFQKGYLLNNKILRPSMVSVAKRVGKKEDAEAKEDTAFKADDNEQREEG